MNHEGQESHSLYKTPGTGAHSGAFSEAGKTFPEHPGYSDRYVALARKIAMRHRVRIEKDYRRRYCHHCYRYLVPGANMRVRVHPGWVAVTCLVCRKTTRYRVERSN